MFKLDAAAPGERGAATMLLAGPMQKKAAEPLGKALLKCPGEGGVNIEGMVVRGGKALFGLRSPAKGDAMVLSVTLGALFEGADDKPALQRVKIAKDFGIRDMAAVAGGFLVVAGPMGDEGGAFPLYLWDGGDRVESVGAFTDLPEKARVEGLLVVEETDRAYSVVVTYDGVPVEGSLPGFEIPKPH